VVPTPPKKEKVWKQKQEAPKSTTTPPKTNRCGNQRRCNDPSLLPWARMYHPQARNEGRGVLLIGL